MCCDDKSKNDDPERAGPGVVKGSDARSMKWAKAVDFQKNTPEKKSQNGSRQVLLKGLYSMIDTNDNGKLELDELSKVMNNADVFLRVCDSDKDNVISKEEFFIWSHNYIVRHLSGECDP
jgi:hypothetical protein